MTGDDATGEVAIDGGAVSGDTADSAPQPGTVFPGTVFVESLPDLIDAAEYADHPDGRLVRFRITVTDSGVEVLGDAFRPSALEALLAELGGGPTEEMLCG